MQLYFETPIGQHGRHILPENLKHSWSKWGRDISMGFYERTDDWACQVCSKIQPQCIDPFVFPISDREFLRICNSCENKRIKYNFHTFEILIMVCRA
jgi:hypothetical protein